MSRTKYLKFGARADKNLSDLSNKVEALDNLLDNISTEFDEDGNALRFTSADLLSLVGLSQTGIARDLNEFDRPKQLDALSGANLQTTDIEGTLRDVSPRLTYQDYINNYKVVLGDPLWTSGGDGPDAFFLPDDRLNDNTDRLGATLKAHLITSGNRYRLEGNLVNETQMDAISVTNKGSAPAVGDIFVAIDPLPGNMSIYNNMDVRNVTLPTGNSGTSNTNALRSDQLYTTKIDSSLTDIVGPEDFWTNGDFTFSYKIHNSFPTTNGGVQWTGYQTKRMDVGFNTTGFFIIEEDVNNDNNWKTLKCCTENTIKTFYPIKWADEGDITRIQLTNEDDFVRVCQGMIITLNNETGEVTNVFKSYDTNTSSFKYYADLDINVGNTESTGSIETFEVDISQASINTGKVSLTSVARGKRRRVRYTVFWPAPAIPQDEVESKYFNETNPTSSYSLQYSFFYKTDGSADVDGVYSFKYFYDNRVSSENQNTSASITVDDTISLEYEPPQIATSAWLNYSTTNNEIALTRVKRTENTGKLEGEDINTNTFSGANVGDYIVSVTQTESEAVDGTFSDDYRAFQILEKESDDTVYVDDSYATIGFNIDEVHTVVIVKNEGLKSIYQCVGTGISNTEDRQLIKALNSSASGSLNSSAVSDIGLDDIVFKADFNGKDTSETSTGSNNEVIAHRYPFRVVDFVSADGSGVGAIGVDPHGKNATDTFTATSSLNFGTSPIQGGPNGILAVYASRGLVDNSATHECGGVFGLEVVDPPGGAPANSNATGGTRIYVKEMQEGANIDLTDYYVYFAGQFAQPTIDQYSGDGDGNHTGTSTKISAVNADGATDKFIDITTALNSPVNAGMTIVIVPDTSYGGDVNELRKNREYCVLPLNTAPPFASTDTGLYTPTTHKGLKVEHAVLEFKELEIEVPLANVIDYDTINWDGNGIPNKRMTIEGKNDTTGANESYKLLINSDTYTT